MLLFLADLLFTTGVAEAGCQLKDPATALQGAIAQSDRLVNLARQIGKELDEGCYFGREAAIAHAVAPVWQACPQDPEIHGAFYSLLARIEPIIYIEDPVLARNLFIETPLTCLENSLKAGISGFMHFTC